MTCKRWLILLFCYIFVIFHCEKAFSAYCSASGVCVEYIYQVQVGSINNNATACSGYADYTSTHSTEMKVGDGYLITVVTAVHGVPYAGYEGDQLGIWIDWNGDEDFYDSGEMVYSADGCCLFTTTITPPDGTASGNKRMRIELLWMGTLSPCGTIGYGEVEDYTIVVPVPSSGYEGSGTIEDPYQIWTAAQMNTIGLEPNDWDKHFKLMADIDLSAYDGKNGRPSFNLIGGEYIWNGSSYEGDGFTGLFDGDGHVIYNFTYESAVTNCLALFRGVERGQIKNLGLVNPTVDGADLTAAMVAVICQGAKISGCWVQGGSITGNDMTGGLAAYTEWNVEITDSYTDITVTGGEDIGGLVGFNNYNGYITRCYSMGNVNGYENVGGFVGISREGLIEQCYATGDVTATYQGVGSFAGCIADYMEINNCYARGNVTGIDYVGNFLGRNTSYTSDLIRCYATGHINGTGGMWVHGMVGRYYPDCYILEYNFFDTQTSGTTDGCAAYGRTTAQMYQQSNYIAGGWDFETPIWAIDEGADYPKLWWQTYYFSDFYGGGTGRAKDPFLIYDADQMNAIGAHPNDWDKHFKLMSDIDLGGFVGEQFNIIGNYITPFTGTFNGNSQQILNFTYGPTSSAEVGLFGVIDGPGCIIKNVKLINSEIYTSNNTSGTLVGQVKNQASVINCSVKNGLVDGSNDIGGLIGVNESGIISDCGFEGVVGAGSTVGGLVGYNSMGATISNSYSKGTVIGFAAIGGLVGESSFNTFILKCYSLSDVQYDFFAHMYFGGLIGTNSFGTVEDCYARGNVTGGSNTGGLIGKNGNNVYNCYSTGEVVGTDYVGGLVGKNEDTVLNSFWDIDTSRISYSSGGTGKTTEQMKTAQTFLVAGWDFNFEDDNGNEDIWTIEEHVDYPRLCSELGLRYGGGTGEPNNPYLIYTAAQMVKIGSNKEDWSKAFKLMADISLASYGGSSYNIIGRSSSTLNGDGPFKGTFDGNLHSISGFSYSASSINYVGIFGYVSNTGIIKNLKIISPNLTDSGFNDMTYVGPIAGYASGSNISDCSVIGGIVQGKNYVGGLVGLSTGYLASSGSSAAVSGNNYIGGFIGSASTFGSLSGISDCFARGNVSGNSYVGGFVGNSSDATVVNCYSKGTVSGTSNFGGFSGYNVNTLLVGNNVVGSFWDIQTSGKTTSASGIGLETSVMQDVDTYMNAGWDFIEELDNGGSNNWAMPAGGGYPVLWHELTILPPLPVFAGGTGTLQEPYLIETEEQLNSISHNARLMDKHFKLICDLEMDGLKYFMIGEKPYVFKGSFDGNGHSIRNIIIKPLFKLTSVGFIGTLNGANTFLKNLTLIDPNISAEWGQCVGSLTGMNQNSSITNCHAVNAIVWGLNSVGGLVGANYSNSSISGCSATGNVSENSLMSLTFSSIGGLVGENSFSSEIRESYAKCVVSGDDCVGGLAGSNMLYSNIINCYSGGSVTGTEDSIGGLVGRTLGSGQIEYSYSSASVTGPTGTDTVGGFIGKTETSGSVFYKACFWDSSINITLPGIGNGTDPNVVGECTENMKIKSTYTSKGWDFANIWSICEGTNYPRLKALIPAGDIICPEGVDFSDLDIFSFFWLDDCSAPLWCCGADINKNHSVNFADFAIFALNWMNSM